MRYDLKILADIYACFCSSRRYRLLLHLGLVLIAGLTVYGNSFTVPFILDDYYSLDFYGKKAFADHLLHGSARRVADITFALNYRLHGLQPAGYHVTNLAIHLSSAILLYFIMVSVVAALRVSYGTKLHLEDKSSLPERFLPLAVTLLFVVHPMQTQAVTYIIQRYTSLATFFYLAATLFFLRARLVLESRGSCRQTVLLFAGTITAALLAVGSKQIAVTLPGMLVAMEMLVFRGRLINRRFYAVCGVLVLMALVVVFIKWHPGSLDDFLFDLRHATAEDQRTPRATYFLTQTGVVASYLGLLCLPLGQSLVHDAPLYNSVLSIPVLASLALHLLLATAAVVLFRISGQKLSAGDWQRGVLQRLAAMGIIWFYLAISLESSVFPIIDVMFEHRIYLPSAGFFMTLTACAALLAQGRRVGVKALWGGLAVGCIILGSITISRNQVWNDPLQLWQEAAASAPNKWLAQANLGNEYLVRNMPEKAIPLYIRAMELNPALFFRTKVNLGDALKALHLYESRFTTGQEYILSGGTLGSGALDYSNMSRWESVISNNQGLAYEYLNEPEKAVKAYRLAVILNPEYDLGWYNLALLSVRLGDRPMVAEAAAKLKILNPGLANEVAQR